MKYQKPINSVNNSDEFSSVLMEAYGKWMGGDCFQNTKPVDLNLTEAFDGMDPQSHGAEIEHTTTKKKTAKKESPKAQLATKEEYEVLEREEYELDGSTYVIEKIKGADGKACWKGYKYAGTKNGKDECVKSGFEPEGNELQEKEEYSFDDKEEKMSKFSKKKHEKSEKKMEKEGYDVEAAEALWSEVAEKLEKLGEIDGAKFKVIGEKLDPVGKADKDIDNDGDSDKSDKYLSARRKKISKIMSMKKK